MSSIFFTSNTRATQGEQLRHINHLSNNSYSWIFNSANSIWSNWYANYALKTSTSLFRDNPSSSSRNTPENSFLIGTFDSSTLSFSESITLARYVIHPFLISFQTVIIEIIQFGMTFLSLLKITLLPFCPYRFTIFANLVVLYTCLDNPYLRWHQCHTTLKVLGPHSSHPLTSTLILIYKWSMSVFSPKEVLI